MKSGTRVQSRKLFGANMQKLDENRCCRSLHSAVGLVRCNLWVNVIKTVSGRQGESHKPDM